MEGWTTLLYAVGNVSCSVSLVLVNKLVFAGGFRFPMSLTFLHFGFTVLFYRAMAAAAFFEPKGVPAFEACKVAAFGVGSIGFMNVSLNLNSVGFYQISKLSIVPCTLVVQYVLFGATVSRKVKLSLALLLLGLALATVTDVQLNAPGLLMATLAVGTTACFQLWQGSKQREFELTGTQLQAAVSAWQAAQSLCAAAALENLCADRGAGAAQPCATAVSFAAAPPAGGEHTLGLVLLTCFIALGTNFSSFGLIGRTSAITFQVVGHAKTCLVLIGGYVLFPSPNFDETQFYHNIAGVSIAMVGVILYGHVKQASAAGKDDCLDCICPTAVNHFLDPKYATIKPAEQEELCENSSGEGGEGGPTERR